MKRREGRGENLPIGFEVLRVSDSEIYKNRSVSLLWILGFV